MPFISSIRKKHDVPNTGADNNFEVTGGDIVYTAGGYKIHMFTQVGNSALNIACKGNSSVMQLQKTGLDVEYMVIGGGAAGGSRHGGGGGAGGMVTSSLWSMPLGSHSTTVGAGGVGILGDSRGPSGGNSVFSSVTALGGGGGGTWVNGGSANPGGSGGGATASNNFNFGSGQQADTGLGGLGHGNPGGNSTVWGNPIGFLRVGGGGGAGGAGGRAAESPQAGNGNTGIGGEGRASSILGTNYFWAAGGGGAGWSEVGAPGGRGGGGGGSHAGQAGTGGLNAGTAGLHPSGSLSTSSGTGGNGGTNTGSGGGGGQQVPSRGGSGGPGIVVVRYRI